MKSELIHDQLDVVDLAPSSAVPIDKTSPPASQSRLQPSSLPSPQRLRTNSRLETAIDEPAAVELASNGDSASAATATAFDYCQVWNDWNHRSGGSLPSRRSRQRPALLTRQMFCGVTDC